MDEGFVSGPDKGDLVDIKCTLNAWYDLATVHWR